MVDDRCRSRSRGKGGQGKVGYLSGSLKEARKELKWMPHLPPIMGLSNKTTTIVEGPRGHMAVLILIRNR